MALTEVPIPAADETDDVAVVADGVARSFDGREVLSGIDLTIPNGQFVALLGRSGSGKSTLLRALAGLDAGYDGQARVPAKRAVVFQDPRLLPWQRVLTNVTIGLVRTTDLDRSAARQAGLAALGEVGLDGHA